MLHYYPRHVSSINMPIFRRKYCIHTASDIVAFCKRLYSTPVKSGHNAEQAKPVYQYKNTKIKLYKNNAAIWYNKTCNPLSTSVLCSRLQRTTIPDAM